MTRQINLWEQVVNAINSPVLRNQGADATAPIANGCWVIRVPRNTTTLDAAPSLMDARKVKNSGVSGSHTMTG